MNLHNPTHCRTIQFCSFSLHPVFGKVNYMTPLDIRQYLYCLSPKPEMYSDPKLLKGVTNIGKLDIVWKTNMGEKGRLQTSPLQRVVSVKMGSGNMMYTGIRPRRQGKKNLLLHGSWVYKSVCYLQVPGYGDIRLTVVSIPEAIPTEKTFDFKLKVTNCWYRNLQNLQNSDEWYPKC